MSPSSSTLESALTPNQLSVLRGLDTPAKIQAYLDTTLYRPEYSNFCPLRVMETGQAHCLDGALFGAAALRRLGHPPLLVDLFPDPGMDDDHVLAVFRLNGRWGAVAKSNFTGLRFREPVYNTLRELIMSYFEHFFNAGRVKTLRTYTLPLNLSRFDAQDWETTGAGADAVEKALLARPRHPLITPAMAAALSPVDDLTFQSGTVGINWEGVYKPQNPGQPE